jgi:hypothetical protein
MQIIKSKSIGIIKLFGFKNEIWKIIKV